MLKKSGLFLLAILGIMVFVGCSNIAPVLPITPKPVITPIITNPISKKTFSLNSTIFKNGLKVKSYQIAVGYPTVAQVSFFNKMASVTKTGTKKTISTPSATPTTKEGTSALVISKRVIAIRYDVTNTSNVSLNMRQFYPNIGYFLNQKTDAPTGYANYSDNSLHNALGVPSYPKMFSKTFGNWNLQPGKKVSYALDWLVPTVLTETANLTLIQNFNFNNTWVSGVKLSVKNIQPSKKGQ